MVRLFHVGVGVRVQVGGGRSKGWGGGVAGSF